MKRDREVSLIVYALLGLIVLVSTLGFVSAYSGMQRLQKDRVSGALILVACSECFGGERGRSQFTGVYATNFVGPATVDGNTAQGYRVSRDSNVPWVVSWSFHKNTTRGVLEVRLVLSNGTVAFDGLTNAPYGTVSAVWDYTGPPH